MWASCCGLLNEVMGTGAVRGQQSGFAGGTGPFRFAPNSDFSTYPPAPTEGANIVCKACGLSFSVFRKKHVCCDCKKDFCSVCSVLQENLRRCSTCHLLQETAFQRPQLMRLKVKDLRQYLILRNIPIDTCREKEDLVDLVLCHRGLGSEDDLDTSSLNSSRSQTSGFFTHSFFSNYTAPSATVSSFQGELMGGDRTLGSEALAQVRGCGSPKGLSRLLGPARRGLYGFVTPAGAAVVHATDPCARGLSSWGSRSPRRGKPLSLLSQLRSLLTRVTSVSLEVKY